MFNSEQEANTAILKEEIMEGGPIAMVEDGYLITISETGSLWPINV